MTTVEITKEGWVPVSLPTESSGLARLLNRPTDISQRKPRQTDTEIKVVGYRGESAILPLSAFSWEVL
jgi:hypothetical protein